MSTVSSVYDSTSLYDLLESTKTQKSSSSSTTSSSSSSQSQKSPSEVLADALKEQGVDDDTISEIQSKIEELMKNSRDQDSDSSTSPTDMKSQIDRILSQYGIDTSSVDSYMQQNMPQPPQGGMGGPGGMPPSDSSLSLTGSSVDVYA